MIYLPPSAAGRSGGYPSGGPQGSGVIAARSGLDHGQAGHGSHGHAAQGNGFSRSGLGHGSHGHGQAQARFGQEQQGYDHNAAAFGRNAHEESEEPANYNFGYMVNDFEEGTDFGHHEERQDERAEGEYHVVLPDGRKQTVSYEADEHGFKPHISYEDTDASARSGGYDSNANNARSGHDSFGNGGHGNHGNARSNGY
ncbi:pro-resilin-like [Cydia splendana]|uniref:pro-resilin-like n=1 Tax=Cydia splendana TaxID=1100963 RepID=UPI00300D67A7